MADNRPRERDPAGRWGAPPSVPAPMAPLIYGPGWEGRGHGHGAGPLWEEREPSPSTQHRELPPRPPRLPGVSPAVEGGRRLPRTRGPAPGVRVPAAGSSARWRHWDERKPVPLGRGRGAAAGPWQRRGACPHAPAPGTVLTHGHGARCGAQVPHRPVATRGRRGGGARGHTRDLPSRRSGGLLRPPAPRPSQPPPWRPALCRVPQQPQCREQAGGRSCRCQGQHGRSRHPRSKVRERLVVPPSTGVALARQDGATAGAAVCPRRAGGAGRGAGAASCAALLVFSSLRS